MTAMVSAPQIFVVSISKMFCLLLLCLLTTACGNQENDILRFGVAKAPANLDPRFATDAISVRINRLLYARLIDYDKSFQPIPAIADWEMPSPTRYVFKLKQDRRIFSDGKTLNALDVVDTYKYVLDSNNASPHRGSLSNISTIEIIGDEEIAFNLSEPDPLFPGRLVIGIVPSSLAQQGHNFNKQPVGSGSFKFLQRTGQEGVIIQRLRDNQIIEFVRVPDPTIRVLKIARGEVDLIQGDIPWELVRWLKQQHNVLVSTTGGTNFSYVGFNLADPVLRDVRVRQAIAHAIDKNAFINHIFTGAARQAGFILDESHWAGASEQNIPKFDPELAKSLLQQAGYDASNPLVLEYKTSSDPFRVRLATVIQAQLAEVGINVNVRPHDWGTFYQDIKEGRFQMYTLAWVGIKLPDIYRYVFHSESIPPNGANRGRLIDARVDQLIELAEQGETLSSQANYYHQLQHYLAALLPYVPLWYESQVAVLNRNWQDYMLAHDGNFDGLNTIVKSQ